MGLTGHQAWFIARRDVLQMLRPTLLLVICLYLSLSFSGPMAESEAAEKVGDWC